MYLNTLNKYECTGCSACEQICPTKAIKMYADEEGFKFPKKDLDKCINCNLCVKVCPIENPSFIKNNDPKVFAAYLKNKEERSKSSSGGIFYTIACYVINQGGFVYGATLDKKLNVIHKQVNTLQDLDCLRGSKYVQSNMLNCFSEIKKQLKNKKLVYFVGTPCQVAGLISFLHKEYENLITSDLICHGTPSQLLFDKHIHYLEQKEKNKVVNYNFRNNKKWKMSEIVTLLKKNGKLYKKVKNNFIFSPFLYSFMYSYTLRYSCYSCPFSKIPRQGDITLADYWGVENFFPNIKKSSGVSLVLINSIIGNRIWDNVKNQFDYFNSNIKDASKFNYSLNNIAIEPKIRKNIYIKINREGYKAIIKRDFKVPNKIFKYIFFYFSKTKCYLFLRKFLLKKNNK